MNYNNMKAHKDTFEILPTHKGLISNYHLLPDEVHYADGYRELVTPTITENQRLGQMIYADDVVTYEVVNLTEEEIRTNIIPQILSPRQFRLALIHSGKSIAGIEAFIQNLPSNLNEKVWITWEYSIQFERSDAMLNEFADALQITQEQLDQIFILGATL